MKLKKLAAVAMAAVMSAAMLTACSGGGGSGSSPTPNGTAFTQEYELVERFANGQYSAVTENSIGYYKDYTTSNGTWIYSKFISVDRDGKTTDEELYSMTESYIVNTHDSDDPSNWKAYKEPPEAPDPDEGDSDTPSKPSPETTTTKGTETYHEVEYDTVTKTTVSHKAGEERKTIVTEYYIKGTNTLAYEKTERKNGDEILSGRVEKVSLTNKVDPKNATKLDISKYKLVNSEDELA